MVRGTRGKKSGKYSPLRGARLPRRKRFRRALDTESGVKVRSKYERTCADFLTRNSITFQYEPLMVLGGRQFRPDFYLPEHNLFLEICGYGHMPYYRDRIRQKEKLYRELKMNAVFIHHDGKGSLEKKIRFELTELGVRFSEDSMLTDI